MPDFKVRMLWPEGPSVRCYKYRQKLQSREARPSQSVTLSAVINYVHPFDGYAGGRGPVWGSAGARSLPSAPPPPARPAPLYLLSPLGRPGVLHDGLPAGPLHPGGSKPGWREAPTRPLTDGRHVGTGAEPVSGGRAFYLSCRGFFPASFPIAPCDTPPPVSPHPSRTFSGP